MPTGGFEIDKWKMFCRSYILVIARLFASPIDVRMCWSDEWEPVFFKAGAARPQ